MASHSDHHHWHERREPHFKIDSGEAVVHQRCRRCGRDMVTVLSSDTRYAVYVGAFVFYRLDDEVTKRWLNERCPGKRLEKDEDVRNEQIAKMLAQDERPERANAQLRSSSSVRYSTNQRRRRPPRRETS
jgi:hypothetical protein